MDPVKLKFQRRMINAIERGDMYFLENWTTFGLHDLEFTAELWNAPIAQSAILDELNTRE